MFALVVFVILVLLFLYFDMKVYNTIFTPTIILVFPFLGVVLVNLLFGKYTDYYALYLPTLWYWCLGLCFFWSSSFVLSTFFMRYVNSGRTQDILTPVDIDSDTLRRFFNVTGLVLVVVMHNYILKSLVRFDFVTNDEAFQASLGVGIGAHCSILLIVPVIYYLQTFSIDKKYIIGGIVCLLWITRMVLYNSKSGLLFIVIAALIGRFIMSNRKLKPKYIFIIVGSGLLFFYASYSVSFGRWAPWSFIINHFVGYVNAGLLSFSEYVQSSGEMGIDWTFLYSPLVNIYNKLIGVESKSIISDLLMPIKDGGNGINVKSFFGSIFIYGGIVGGIITSFVWGLISYSLLILSFKLRRTILFILYVYFLSALFFAWFDIYFNALKFYEILIFWGFMYLLGVLILNRGKVTVYSLKKNL